MYKVLFTLLVSMILTMAFSQTAIDFEDFDIPIDTFLNGSNAEGQFETKGLRFPNDFNPEFQSWTGWSISSIRDSVTAGFGNQYAAITATGFEDSQNYAVSFQFGENAINIPEGPAKVGGFYITNNTYTYLSMRDGDAFAKKFGGETGDDPDFFLVHISGYLNGEKADSVDFYLADYRFEDNAQDYLISDWTFVDLSSFGEVDSLGFSLSSSDNGQFGMNTPAYFCLDQIIFQDSMTTSTNDVFVESLFDIYPNPVVDQLNIKHELSNDVSVQIYGILGNLVFEERNMYGKNIDVSALESGTYIIQISSVDQRSSRMFIKH